jgi:predicted nuclease of predicted toxin-antitoxin system
MKIWLDAQLSPALAPWVSVELTVAVIALRDLGLRDSTDREIFFAAREAGAVVITKDSDFVKLPQDLGPPPQIIWLAFGNTSNARLKKTFAQTLNKSLDLIRGGESLVEISAVWL